MDAVFAPHADSKLHTGIAVFIVRAMVFEVLRKQKYITKSPTESELVSSFKIFSVLLPTQRLTAQ
jgi:hypothetical protein